jgi:hypothetical protein
MASVVGEAPVEGGEWRLTHQHRVHKESVRRGSNSMKAGRRRGLTTWVDRRRWRLRNLQMAAVFDGGDGHEVIGQTGEGNGELWGGRTGGARESG